MANKMQNNEPKVQESPANIGKAKRVRSPNYPALSLDEALGLAQKLYEKFGMTPVPMPIALEYLGYSTKSSTSRQIIAAISSYGLITGDGSGLNKRLKISPLAFKILKDPLTTNRDEALKTAALEPAIFSKIMQKYQGNIPESRILAYDLEKEGEFNRNSIQDFIGIFLRTIGIAKISGSDIIGSDISSLNEQNESESGEIPMITTEIKPDLNIKPTKTSPQSHSAPLAGKERKIAEFPVGSGLYAKIVVFGNEAPFTIDSMKKLMNLLEITKEDIVEATKEKDPEKQGS